MTDAVTTVDIRNVVIKVAEFAREHGCDIDVALVVHGFDRWLAGLKAEIWAEGFDAGLNKADEHEAHWSWGVSHTCITNPYREETE